MLTALDLLLPLLVIVLMILPLWLIASKKANQNQKRRRMLAQISVFFGSFILIFIFQINNFVAYAASPIEGTIAQGMGFLAAALVTLGSTIGGGIAVSSAASAAIGAISENEENFGKALVFVALAEGVAIYGLLISILIISKL